MLATLRPALEEADVWERIDDGVARILSPAVPAPAGNGRSTARAVLWPMWPAISPIKRPRSVIESAIVRIRGHSAQ